MTMSKKVEKKRNQLEFRFVFNRYESSQKSTEDQQRPRNTASLTEELAKSHRDKLLSELRKNGC